MIGIYLDNAIDASVNEKNNNLSIEIFTNNKELSILITNTFANEIDFVQIDKKGYSTKGKTRGYGLYIAKEILEKNKKISQSREISNDLYIQKIVIK